MDVHTENLNVPQRFFTNFAVKVAQNCIPKWHGIVRRNHHLSATIQPDLKSWPMCPQAPQSGDVPIGVCTDLILWSATFLGAFWWLTSWRWFSMTIQGCICIPKLRRHPFEYDLFQYVLHQYEMAGPGALYIYFVLKVKFRSETWIH